jgi:tRNA1Val (adenine37-N6)-methyltransferase
MSVFHFKQFNVTQTQSAMKIGTDSVLLGCVCDCNGAASVLDIGTGTGLLALMLAQKCHAPIHAIEIDELAAAEASFNFAQSRWKNRLSVVHTSLQEFQTLHRYDLIISNPPYFRHTQQFKLDDLQRSRARHDQDLPFEILAQHVHQLLSTDGNFWCILPTQESSEFIKICASIHLHLRHETRVIPKQGKAHNRLIMCFTKAPVWETSTNEITIYNEDGSPTDAYKQLTFPYYLWKGDESPVALKW